MLHTRAVWFAFVLFATAVSPTTTASAGQDQAAGLAPVAIRIPTAVVDTTIEPLQIADERPETPSGTWVVGWYEELGGLADDENSVLYGLPDFAGPGPGVFWFLDRLSAGDAIEVTGDDGLIYPFVVSSITMYDRDTAPIGQIYGQTGEEALTLFTAGPPYDEQGDYRTLIVVLATPSGAAFAPLENTAVAADTEPCTRAPHILEMNGQTLAPVAAGETAREQLDSAGALPASDEEIASMQAALQAATDCPIVVREALILTDGRAVALVGPSGMIPLEELTNPGGFDMLGSAPEARALAYVVFTQGSDGWVAEGIPTY